MEKGFTPPPHSKVTGNAEKNAGPVCSSLQSRGLHGLMSLMNGKPKGAIRENRALQILWCPDGIRPLWWLTGSLIFLRC